MPFHVVIPARYASTRLPGKVLAPICGKPLIRWVAEAAERSAATSVVVATDHPEVIDALRDLPRTSAMLTRVDHACGTDRVAEVAERKGWSADTLIVNVQGDEPTLPPTLIDQVAQVLENAREAALGTLCTPIRTLEEFLDPNVVKVTLSDTGMALYFSRAPIPWNRDSARDLYSQREFPHAYRHLGIYAYRVGALLQLTRLPVSALERVEKLEQLRALQAGLRVAIAVAVAVPGPGVDTAADLERVRQML